MGDDRWALEDSNGKFIYNPSENDILSVLEKIGKGLDHCNFSGPADTWVSAAGSSDSLMIYYGDSSGQYESVRYDFTAAEAARIFSSLMDGDSSWKKENDFNSTGAAPQAQSQSQFRSGSAGTDSAGTGSFTSSNESGSGQAGEKKSLKDQLIDAAKSEAANNLNRLVKKGVRGLFGKKF